MKDCFGREIKAGDVVAYTSNDNGPCLCVAEVLGPSKSDPENKIRVKVFQSEAYRFRYGHKRRNWKSPDRETIVVREPNQPYLATIGMPERVIIVGNDVTQFKPAA